MLKLMGKKCFQFDAENFCLSKPVMTILYPNLCYNEACYKVTALYTRFWYLAFVQKPPLYTQADLHSSTRSLHFVLEVLSTSILCVCDQ